MSTFWELPELLLARSVTSKQTRPRSRPVANPTFTVPRRIQGHTRTNPRRCCRQGSPRKIESPSREDLRHLLRKCFASCCWPIPRQTGLHGRGSSRNNRGYHRQQGLRIRIEGRCSCRPEHSVGIVGGPDCGWNGEHVSHPKIPSQIGSHIRKCYLGGWYS